MAKNPPATSAAGHTSIIPRKPAIAQTTQNGMRQRKHGQLSGRSWLESFKTSMPVTPLNAMMGVPKAPNATGAVLAISERPEAMSGRKPSWIRMALVMATGVPNPAAPFKKCAEGKCNQYDLDARVGRQRCQAAAQDRRTRPFSLSTRRERSG